MNTAKDIADKEKTMTDKEKIEGNIDKYEELHKTTSVRKGVKKIAVALPKKKEP